MNLSELPARCVILLSVLAGEVLALCLVGRVL